MSDKSASGKPTCMEMLQAIIDGDASQQQQEDFKEHMYGCMPCYQKYNLEMVIKELIKSKCCGQDAPADLIQKIKAKIEQNTTS